MEMLGGGAGGGGEGDLEGDVRFGTDLAFNLIYVSGATGKDLDEISALIDVFDQRDPPHRIEFEKTYTIDIIHRDPQEVKDLVQNQISDRVDTGESQGGGQKNDQQKMMQMMQQLAGGKKGGGNTASEQKKPKCKLGVDLQTSKLLVTGPKFIYEEIALIVMDLDVESLSVQPDVVILKEIGNGASIKETLKAVFGDKVVIVESGEAAAGTGPPRTGNSPATTGTKAKTDAAKVQEAARSNFMNMIRAQQGGQRGGAQRGGATPRGGATRGGRGGGR